MKRKVVILAILTAVQIMPLLGKPAMGTDALMAMPEGMVIGRTYERNPYLDTYRLTLRLLGLHSLEHGELVSHKVGNGQSWNLQRKGNTLIFKNDSELTMSVPEKAISIMKVLPDGKPLIDVEWQINDYPEEIKVSAGEQFIMTIDDLLASDNQYLKIHWFGDIYFCAREDGINDDFDMTLFDLSTC